MSVEEREAIEGYAGGPAAQVRRALGGGLFEVYCGDVVPKAGALVWLGEVGGRVERLVGSGLVEARVLSLDAAASPSVGDAVRLSSPVNTQAAFPAPQAGVLDLVRAMFCSADEAGALSYEPVKPRFMELDGSRDALRTGVKALDLLSPLARGGLNVVVNLSGSAHPLRALADGLHTQLRDASWVQLITEDATLAMDGAALVRSEGIASGLRALGSWCVARRAAGVGEQVVCVSLPALGEALREVDAGAWSQQGLSGVTLGEVLSWLGEALASTHGGRVTTLVEVRLSPAARQLGELLETLALGGVDAVIVVDEEGCYEPWRSTSAAERPDAEHREAQRVRGALDRARKAAERARLFGELELEDEERAALAEVGDWRAPLGAADQSL